MNVAYFQPLMDWIVSNPSMANMVVFAIAAGESLAVIGVLIPGVVLMLGIGALVGLGYMELWSTLAWAVGGAVVGDGISYWLGRHYRMQLQSIWPLTRYPDLLSNGRAFFERHGGKSVLFGRFFGPVRAIIPAIAGMMNMSPWRFYSINVVSALAWAPVVLLPGVAFGAALGLAAEIASRLAIALVVFVVLLWVTFWLVIKVYRTLQPRADAYIERLLSWGHKHPGLNPMVSAIFNPDYPETRGLAELGIILIVSVVFFAALVQVTITTKTLLNLDNTIIHLVAEFRSPPVNSVMMYLVRMSDASVTFVFCMLVSSWLITKKYWNLFAHWVAACVFGFMIPLIIGIVVPLPNEQIADLGLSVQTFPNLEVTSAVTVYGFFAVVAAKSFNLQFRWVPYAVVSVWFTAVVLARTITGLQLFSTLMGAITLGMLWVAVVGIAYRRRSSEKISNKFILIFLFIPLFGIIWQQISPDSDFGLKNTISIEMSQSEWEAGNWSNFPQFRNDLKNAHEHPFTLQWAGSKDSIKSYLSENGWTVPELFSLKNGLLWFAKNPKIMDLPILPHIHGGVYASIVMIKKTSSINSLAVLRLWKTNSILREVHQSIWIGNVSYLRKSNPWGMFVYAKTEFDFMRPLAEFRGSLNPDSINLVSRNRTNLHTSKLIWDGSVLLLQNR